MEFHHCYWPLEQNSPKSKKGYAWSSKMTPHFLSDRQICSSQFKFKSPNRCHKMEPRHQILEASVPQHYCRLKTFNKLKVVQSCSVKFHCSLRNFRQSKGHLLFFQQQISEIDRLLNLVEASFFKIQSVKWIFESLIIRLCFNIYLKVIIKSLPFPYQCRHFSSIVKPVTKSATPLLTTLSGGPLCLMEQC